MLYKKLKLLSCRHARALSTESDGKNILQIHTLHCTSICVLAFVVVSVVVGKSIVSEDSLKITDTLLELTNLPKDIAQEIAAFSALHSPELSAESDEQMKCELIHCKRKSYNLIVCELVLFAIPFLLRKWLGADNWIAMFVMFATLNVVLLFTEAYALWHMARVTPGVYPVLACASSLRVAWLMLPALTSLGVLTDVTFAVPTLLIIVKCVHCARWARWTVGVTWDESGRWLYVHGGCENNQVWASQLFRIVRHNASF